MKTTDGIVDDQTPLVRVLLGLTVVTGVVDAISFLGLGHIFTANMTGNVVFLGFAAGGAPGIAAATTLVDLVCFHRRSARRRHQRLEYRRCGRVLHALELRADR